MTDSSARPAYNLTQSNPIYPLLHVNTSSTFSFFIAITYAGKFLFAFSSYATAKAIFLGCLLARERHLGNKHALKSFISQKPLKPLAGAAGPGVVYICLQHQRILIEASWLTTLLMTVVRMRIGRISFPMAQRSYSKIGLKFATTLIQLSHLLGLHRLLSRTTRRHASRARITTRTVIGSPQYRVAENDNVPTMGLGQMKTLITIMGTDLSCKIYPWVIHRFQQADRTT